MKSSSGRRRRAVERGSEGKLPRATTTPSRVTSTQYPRSSDSAGRSHLRVAGVAEHEGQPRRLNRESGSRRRTVRGSRRRGAHAVSVRVWRPTALVHIVICLKALPVRNLPVTHAKRGKGNRLVRASSERASAESPPCRSQPLHAGTACAARASRAPPGPRAAAGRRRLAGRGGTLAGALSFAGVLSRVGPASGGSSFGGAGAGASFGSCAQRATRPPPRGQRLRRARAGSAGPRPGDRPRGHRRPRRRAARRELRSRRAGRRVARSPPERSGHRGPAGGAREPRRLFPARRRARPPSGPSARCCRPTRARPSPPRSRISTRS